MTFKDGGGDDQMKRQVFHLFSYLLPKMYSFPPKNHFPQFSEKTFLKLFWSDQTYLAAGEKMI